MMSSPEQIGDSEIDPSLILTFAVYCIEDWDFGNMRTFYLSPNMAFTRKVSELIRNMT